MDEHLSVLLCFQYVSFPFCVAVSDLGQIYCALLGNAVFVHSAQGHTSMDRFKGNVNNSRLLVEARYYCRVAPSVSLQVSNPIVV